MLLTWGINCFMLVKGSTGCPSFHVFAFAKTWEELLVTQQLGKDHSPSYPWLVDVPVEITSMSTAFFFNLTLQIAIKNRYLQICKARSVFDIYFEGILMASTHNLCKMQTSKM